MLGVVTLRVGPVDVGGILGSGIPTVVLFWGVAAGIRLVREPRVVLALLVLSAAVLAVARVPAVAVRLPLALGTLALGLGILLWPGPLGLLAVRGAAADADATLRRASTWLRGTSRDPEEAAAVAASLAPGTFPGAGGEWAEAATLMRLAVNHSTGGDRFASRQSDAYASAARAWWRAAAERGQLGPRFHPRPFDEHMAIRAAYERFIALVPLRALTPDALVPIGGWDDEADGVIDELETLRLRAPLAREARTVVVEALRDHLAVARGDRSPVAYARQAASAERAQAAWDALAETAGG